MATRTSKIPAHLARTAAQNPPNREIEAKLRIAPMRARNLLLSPCDNELVQMLIDQGRLSSHFHYRIPTQHTLYMDTEDGLLEKGLAGISLNLRRRMHAEDGLLVEGLKSLVETRNIQDRYERETGRLDIYAQASSYIIRGSKRQQAKNLNHVWHEVTKLLFPQPAAVKPHGTLGHTAKSLREQALLSLQTLSLYNRSPQQQVRELLQMFDLMIPINQRPQHFSYPALQGFNGHKLPVKKALSRVLMQMLPIQQEQLDFYAKGLSSQNRKRLKGRAADLKVVGFDEVVRCFYPLLYKGHEYELAIDGGFSQGNRLAISEIEVEAKAHHGQRPPKHEDLEYLRDEMGAFVVQAEIKIGVRPANDHAIYPSPSKGASNAMVRRQVGKWTSDPRHQIIQPKLPAVPCAMIAEVLAHYGP